MNHEVLENLAPGDFVADLHYGWATVREHFDVVSMTEFEFRHVGSGAGTLYAWIHWLDTVGMLSDRRRRYENKQLMVIAKDPDVVVGWCYDGRRGGLATLRRKG